MLLLSATGLFTACSTVNLDDSGDTQAVYQFGGFEMLLNSTAPIAFNAAQKALKDLDLYQTKGQLNAYDAQIYARSRNDQKISIEIKEINSKQTLLKIRWGTAGSKANSRALYDAIEKNMH
jgi:cell division protein FtsL